MPEETTVTVSTEGTTPAVTPPADATGPNSGTDDRKFTQADLDRIIKDRLEQERNKAKDAAAKMQADAEAKVLEEQGKFKELYEKQQAELQAAHAKARELELSDLRRQAAEKASLPASLAERLKGETLEELMTDARGLVATLPKPGAPNINATNSGAPRPLTVEDLKQQRRPTDSIYQPF